MRNNKKRRFLRGFFMLHFFLFIFFSVTLTSSWNHEVYAQEFDAIDIAEIYPINTDNTDEVIRGDIISYSKTDSSYVLSISANDDPITGVVVERPLLLFQTNTDGFPLAQFGQIEVNVTTIGGLIGTGDTIMSSEIPGKGKKAGFRNSNIVGYALEPFPAGAIEYQSTSTVLVDGKEFLTGSILVDLKIGNFYGTTTPIENLSLYETQGRETRTAIQYIVAALVAIGSIYFAFHNFGTSIQNAIISTGRNPQAKVSIQTALIFHLLVTLAISITGIYLSMIILRIQFF